MPDEKFPVCPVCYDIITKRLEAGMHVPIDDYKLVMGPAYFSYAGLGDMERGDESFTCIEHRMNLSKLSV